MFEREKKEEEKEGEGRRRKEEEEEEGGGEEGSDRNSALASFVLLMIHTREPRKHARFEVSNGTRSRHIEEVDR